MATVCPGVPAVARPRNRENGNVRFVRGAVGGTHIYIYIYICNIDIQYICTIYADMQCMYTLYIYIYICIHYIYIYCIYIRSMYNIRADLFRFVKFAFSVPAASRSKRKC